MALLKLVGGWAQNLGFCLWPRVVLIIPQGPPQAPLKPKRSEGGSWSHCLSPSEIQLGCPILFGPQAVSDGFPQWIMLSTPSCSGVSSGWLARRQWLRAESKIRLLIRLQTFPELPLCMPGTAPATEGYLHNVGVRHSHGLREALSSRVQSLT